MTKWTLGQLGKQSQFKANSNPIKANSKPIQTQLKPKQTQTNPNFETTKTFIKIDEDAARDIIFE
jgi:hypothetical protein